MRSPIPAAGSARLAEVIDASGPHPDRVDGATVLKILAERKLLRVLTEGGPMLLGMLIEDDLLDELCLTIAPLLVGGMARASSPAPARCTPRCGAATCSPTTAATCTRATSARPGALGAAHDCRQYCGRCVASSGPCPEHLEPSFLSALLAGCSPGLAANPALCHRLRGRPPGPAGDQQAAGRAARDRGTQERPVLAQLHVAGVQRRRRPAAPRRHAGLRQLRRRPRLDQRRHRDR